MPKVSVIVPIYNVEKYLEKCINSLLSQTLEDIQIILVNDGSKDNSGNIAKECEKNNKDRVIYVEKENGGLSDARNYGLKCAKGKYVVFVDSDDWVTDDFFEFICNHLNENPVDILKYGFQRVSNNKLGEVIVPYYDEGMYKKTQIKSDILPGAIGPIQLFNYDKNALMSACTCAYSTSFLKKNNIFAFINIAKVSSYGDFYKFCSLFSQEK